MARRDNSVLLFLILLIDLSSIFCKTPMELCRSRFGARVSTIDTYFRNSNCKLQCNLGSITRRIEYMDVNDEAPCRFNDREAGFCRRGECVKASVYVRPENGRLTILATNAYLNHDRRPNFYTYLQICVINNVNDMLDPLPLNNYTWTYRCHSCSSDVVEDIQPKYESPCLYTDRYQINRNSIIIFEIWQYDLARRRPVAFLAGSKLKLSEVINDGQLGRKIPMSLSYGPVRGSMQTEIRFN